MHERRLFALDHNFPEPIVSVMQSFIASTELVPVRLIDPGFSKLDDWELLRALRQHERGWDGLITSDDSMLNLEMEMSVLTQPKLTLVVASGQGHNPIRATGVLLAHIDNICHQTMPTKAQIWNLNVSQKQATAPWDELTKIAKRKGTTAKALFDACRMPELDG